MSWDRYLIPLPLPQLRRFLQFKKLHLGEQNIQYRAYLLKLLYTQRCHVNWARTTPKCDQDTLTSKFLYQGDVKADREDGYVPIAKAFNRLCV